MTTILVSVLPLKNLEWMSILRLMLPAPIANHHSSRGKALDGEGVHEVATQIFPETRKPESKLDAIVNLVTQLAANQKPSSTARVCDIRSTNDHHTSVCPGVDEHPEAYAINTYSRPPQQQRQGN
ncbi:hypothetical protein Fmac_028670 [Flemingia macrophylla]|uniref:Uncharacterized protein n=1 Tax=Flemingia macrophylla TaxID=520843 RepID=A0ABD1L891_9FABA